VPLSRSISKAEAVGFLIQFRIFPVSNIVRRRRPNSRRILCQVSEHITPINILAYYFRRFYDHAAALNVSADALYTALLADAEDQPPNWNIQGRQATAWKNYSQ
jgi:hypothetical protein